MTNTATTTDTPVLLPSGCSIDPQTWAWMLAEGTWRGFLDGRMYRAEDREFMDRELSRA